MERVIAGPLLVAALALFSSAKAEASPILTFTDARGVVHLTNLRPHGAAKSRRAQAPLVPMVLLDAVIAESAETYNLPRALVKAVIATESNYNPWAVSEKGAVGLMQLMPETAREMFVRDAFDPVQNIQGGARYLRLLVNLFGGDLVKVLAAYNAGPEVVKRAQARGPEFVVPNIPETQEYVRRVLQNYRSLKSVSQADSPWAPSGARASGESS